MIKRISGAQLLLIGTLAVGPAVALLAGCGSSDGTAAGGASPATRASGGPAAPGAPSSPAASGSSAPAAASTASFGGSYSGTYTVQAGPDNGKTGPLSVTVKEDGTAVGDVKDASGASAGFSGAVDLASGAFNFKGGAASASGTLVKQGTGVNGSGSFSMANGSKGTIAFSKS